MGTAETEASSSSVDGSGRRSLPMQSGPVGDDHRQCDRQANHGEQDHFRGGI